MTTAIEISDLTPMTLPLTGNEITPADRAGETGSYTPAGLWQYMVRSGLCVTAATFSSLASAAIDPNVTMIETLSWGACPNVGGARYINVTSSTPSYPSWGQNVWWVLTANNLTFVLSPDETITPAKMGAPLNGVSNDLPAVQLAVQYVEYLNANYARKATVSLEGRTYYCSSGKITIDPLFVGLDGEGAQFDFSAKATSDPSNTTLFPELNSSPYWTSATGWGPGPLVQGADPWVISGGTCSHTVTTTTTGGQYNDISRRFSAVQAGQTYTFTFTVQSISAAVDQNYLSFRVVDGYDENTNTYPGYGYGAGLAYVIEGPISTPTTYTVTFTAPTTVGSGGAWVGFQTNNNVVISYLSIRAAPDNTCILIRSNDGDPQYGQELYGMDRVSLIGPGPTSFAVGLQFDTLINSLSSRGQYTKMVVHGFDQGILFGNRSYIIDFYGIAVYNNNTCVACGLGTADAGEMIVFHGSTLSNSQLALSNPGGFEFIFLGCSFDYCIQFYIGIDGVKAYGTHFETIPPTTSTGYMFTLTGAGDFYTSCCTFLANGLSTTVNSWFYGMDKFSRFILSDPRIYGYESNTNALMTGLGRMIVEGRVDWGQHHDIALIPKNDSNHNLFGTTGSFDTQGQSYPYGSLGLLGWLQLGSGVTARSGNQLTFGSTGTETMGVVSGYPTHSGSQCLLINKSGVGSGTGLGAWLAAPIKPFAQAVCSFWYYIPPISGAPTGNTLSGALAAGSMTIVSAQPLTSLSGQPIILDSGQSNQEAVTTTGPSTGTGPYSTPVTATASAHANGAVVALGVELYFQAFFISIVGYDCVTGISLPDNYQTQPVPILSPDQSFFGEVNVFFDPAYGLPFYQQAVFNTLYADESSGSVIDGLAPAWASHVGMTISAINAPSGFNMYVDDVAAFQWGG